MNSLHRRLVYIAILIVIIIGITFSFYISDKKMIHQEAQTKEWTDVTIQWLFVPIPSLRYYRVTYTDGLGVSQKKRLVVEVTKVTWRDDE